MNYFVTGATGFLGGYLVEELLADGHDVVALCRTPDEAGDLAEKGVEIVEGDITEKESMREAMDGTDGVFHLAAWYRVGVDAGDLPERINVDGTRNVLELVDELDVPKAVYTSSVVVNSDTNGKLVDERYRYGGEHITEYDRTKWKAHYEVAEPMVEDGLPLVTVMPGVMYGPGDTSDLAGLRREYLKGELPAIPRKTAYCWGHVEDTAKAHVAAMEDGTVGEDYIVAGEPYTLVEMFELAEEITGIPAPRSVPAWLFSGMAPLAAIADRVIDLPQDYKPESLRAMAGPTYVADNSKAERELGLEHRPFEEGLRETLAHELDELGIDLPRAAR